MRMRCDTVALLFSPNNLRHVSSTGSNTFVTEAILYMNQRYVYVYAYLDAMVRRDLTVCKCSVNSEQAERWLVKVTIGRTTISFDTLRVILAHWHYVSSVCNRRTAYIVLLLGASS